MDTVKRFFKNLFFDRYAWIIAGIFAVAILIRFFLISNFDYYSDSYYFELTGKFIKEHFSIDGFLGAGGEYYQPLFYKFGYSLWIAGFDFVFRNLDLSAHFASLLFGIGSVFLFWLFIKELPKRAKILALILFGLSFTTTALSGFVLSETTALFFLLLTLALFQQKKFNWAGLAFGMAVCIRLEFALLLLPFFFWAKNDQSLKKFANFSLIAIGFYAALLGIFVLRAQNFSEMTAFWSSIIQRNFLMYLPYFLAGAIVLMAFWLAKLGKKVWAIAILILALATGIVLWFLLKGSTPNLAGLWAFLQKDWLLAFGFFGLFLLKGKREIYYLIIFILLLLYGRRGDFRFFIYMTPFLAVGSAILFDYVLNYSKKMYKVIFGILTMAIIVQVITLFVPWHPAENYEKILATKLSLELDNLKVDKSLPILSAVPETVFLKSNRPVYKFGNVKYQFWRNLAQDQKIIFVLDEMVYQMDPVAYDKIFTMMADQQLGFFRVDESLFINAKKVTPTHSVILLEAKISELEKILSIGSEKILTKR